MTSTSRGSFYEEDEPIDEIERAWFEGIKTTTSPPLVDRWVVWLGVCGIMSLLVGWFIALFTPLTWLGGILCLLGWLAAVAGAVIAMIRAHLSIRKRITDLEQH